MQYIAIREDEEESLQIKIWTLGTENPEKELLRIYAVLIDNFDFRAKEHEKTHKIFDGTKDDLAVNDTSVQKTEAPIEDRVLEEEFNDIMIFSLPIIFNAKDVASGVSV